MTKEDARMRTKSHVYKESGLKSGDKVRMVNCYEARLPGNADRVWVVRSEPWKLGHGEEVVLLEGKVGGFATECLERVE